MAQLENGQPGINALPSNDEVKLMSYILDAKQAVAFTTSFIPFNVVPSSFIALCRLRGNEDDMMDQMIRREDERIVNDAAYMERSLFRNERKRGRRTRGPFRGIIEVGVTFEQKLKLAKKVVSKLGVPFKNNKRGRKRLFSTRKLVERVFGNITKRKTRSYYRSFDSRIKADLLAGIIHNILAYYRSVKWTDLFR